MIQVCRRCCTSRCGRRSLRSTCAARPRKLIIIIIIIIIITIITIIIIIIIISLRRAAERTWRGEVARRGAEGLRLGSASCVAVCDCGTACGALPPPRVSPLSTYPYSPPGVPRGSCGARTRTRWAASECDRLGRPPRHISVVFLELLKRTYRGGQRPEYGAARVARGGVWRGAGGEGRTGEHRVDDVLSDGSRFESHRNRRGPRGTAAIDNFLRRAVDRRSLAEVIVQQQLHHALGAYGVSQRAARGCVLLLRGGGCVRCCGSCGRQEGRRAPRPWQRW